MVLVDQNCLIIGLGGIMAARVKRTRQARIATILANRIRVVLRAESRSQRDVRPRMPFVLAVNYEIEERAPQQPLGREGLGQLREISRRGSGVNTALEKSIESLWDQLSNCSGFVG